MVVEIHPMGVTPRVPRRRWHAERHQSTLQPVRPVWWCGVEAGWTHVQRRTFSTFSTHTPVWRQLDNLSLRARDGRDGVIGKVPPTGIVAPKSRAVSPRTHTPLRAVGA